MNVYALIGGILIAVAIFAGGVKAGRAMEGIEWAQEKAARQERVIVRQQKVIVEVPKIVERVVTRERVVEKEVDRVVTVVEKAIPVDCVLPDNFGMLLVSAARGLDPETPGVADATGGAYGCRETLAATLADLKAGWINSARLEGLQQYVRTVTEE